MNAKKIVVGVDGSPGSGAARPLAIIPIHEPDTAVDALGRKQREPKDKTLAAHDRLLTDRSPTRLRH